MLQDNLASFDIFNFYFFILVFSSISFSFFFRVFGGDFILVGKIKIDTSRRIEMADFPLPREERNY